jgi:hypothetical protein
MTDRLGQKQTAAMFTLMVLAREVSNTELKDITGFTLVGKERTQLNDLELVASDRRKNLFHHILTEPGWAWCSDELVARTPPPPRGSLATALYVVLGGLDGYLRRENLRLAHIFAPVAELTTQDIEDRIRTAYRKLARSPRDWVGLVDLRPMLGDASTQDVDAVLKELSRTRQAHLVPDSNRKALTAADHAAAVRVGGEDNHLISIEVS